MYLTYAEYSDISFNPVPEEQFTKQLASASFTLDSVTGYFYHGTDLETDVAQRKQAFKRAVAITIDYYGANGSTSQFATATGGQSITIGRTSMSENSSNTSAVTKSQFGNLPIDVDNILGPTGLLFKGVRTLC